MRAFCSILHLIRSVHLSGIQNQQALIDIFGEYPSFHDAEVLSILLDRDGEASPSLTIQIHAWHMTNEVDQKGYFILKNQTVITFLFGQILLESLSGFNHQNVLWDLEIDEIDSEERANEGCCYKVFMSSSYGCEVLFKCQSITVVSAVPYLSAVR